MKLQSKVVLPKTDHLLSYQNKIVLFGSCFAENIGAKLQYYKFPIWKNPFGILYNPASIASAIHKILEEKEYTLNDIQKGKYYYSFDFHSDFAGTEAEQLPDLWNEQMKKSYQALKEAKELIITFGTAWVYELEGEIVANCHQEPAKRFIRRRLEIEEIVNQWLELIHQLQEFNPSLKITFTVSPVRHWKDGARENQLSKSILHLAIDQLLEKFNHCGYFPAYEIQMDELRDYRFYKEDMMHPSQLAVDYIWERFKENRLGEESIKILNTVGKILQMLNHKVRFPESKAYQEYIESTRQKAANLTRQYPFLDFSDEFRSVNQ